MLRRLLTLVGYLVATLLVIGVTVALVAYGNDYAYDFAAKKIIQKGHVILASVPSGVEVSEGGRDVGKKTPYQAAWKVGMHSFGLSRDGYRSWQKTFEVIAGQVSLARYAILVPDHPVTKVLDRPAASVVAQAVSKDHRHLAYVTTGAAPAVYTLNLDGSSAVTLYTPKAASGSTGVETVTAVTWSDDASHLLISSMVDGKLVQRLAAASGGEPINLTAQYGFEFAGLVFSASNWRQLYWISPEGLRKLDVGEQKVSGVLADRVSQFYVASTDRILYVQRLDTGQSLWSLDSRGRKQELIQALVASDSYALSYGNYRGSEEVAVVPASTGVGTLYTDLFGNASIAKTLARGVTGVSFSPDGHFLVFTAPTMMVTYDLEASAIGGSSVLYSATDQPGKLTGLTWFDNFHMLVTRDGRLYWCEFDGANRLDLGAVAGEVLAYRTADFKSLVVLRPGTKGAVWFEQMEIRP